MRLTVEQLEPRLALDASLAPLPSPHVTWAVVGSLPSVTHEQAEAIFTAAWQEWADVCGIDPHEVTDPATADIVITFSEVDGPGSILAESDTPANIVGGQEHSYFDFSENWANPSNPDAGGLSLLNVAAHEIGHLIGFLDHLPPGNLMYGFYQQNISKPQAGDITAIQSLYGPSLHPPPPTPAPTPPPAPGTPLPPQPPFPDGAIMSVYEHYLGRDPVTSEVVYWRKRIVDDGLGVDGFSRAVAGSPEATVEGLYQRYLHRDADQTGRADFLAAVTHGATGRDIARGIVLSQEYQGAAPLDEHFVLRVYDDTFGPFQAPGATIVHARDQPLAALDAIFAASGL